MFNSFALTNLLLVAALFLNACGNQIRQWKNSNNNNKNKSEINAATELKDGKEYALGSCENEFGCIKGFISHGLPLVLRPENKTTTYRDVKNNAINFSAIQFKDAQDFGDRFDTAFIKPLIPEDSVDQYDIKIVPTIRRQNFSSGFELYSEGLSANDDRLTLEGEGNFVLGDIFEYDDVSLRAVKTLRIEISGNADAKSIIEPKIICLEIATQINHLKVLKGEPSFVGGLSSFEFYYTEDEQYCLFDDASGTDTSPTSAKTLDPVKPVIPGIE